MLAFPPFPGRRLSSAAKTRGFTLVELLTVVAIIMILAGIAIGVQRGAYASQADAKARAELHSIANALESYKAAYGTYPALTVTTTASSAANTAASDLVRHLTGRAYMRYNSANSTWSAVTLPAAEYRESFLDLTSMKLNNKTATTPYLVDPWGLAYGYAYSPTGTAYGENFFILYSKGPDKKPAVSSEGGHYTTPSKFASAKAYLQGDSANERVDDIVYGLENLKN